MNQTPVIINATEKNHQEIAEVSIKCWKQAYKNILDQDYLENISVETKIASRSNWFLKPNTFSVATIIENKIIGFCDFGESRHPELAKGEIYTLYVLEEYQRHGIGTMLTNEAIRQLGIHRLKPVVVLSLEDNIKADIFYKKLEFSFIKKIQVKIGERYYNESFYVYE
jgi:ribosomal protein S18 acetylase RimI-like enzyme